MIIPLFQPFMSAPQTGHIDATGVNFQRQRVVRVRDEINAYCHHLRLSSEHTENARNQALAHLMNGGSVQVAIDLGKRRADQLYVAAGGVP